MKITCSLTTKEHGFDIYLSFLTDTTFQENFNHLETLSTKEEGSLL